MIPELEPRGKEWPSLGPYVCRWIEDHLVFGPGDLLGQPAKLDEEKQFLLWRAYEIYPAGHDQAGRRRFKRVCFSLRKGSAKTELMAWIAAAELAPDAPVRCDGFRKDGTPIVRPVSNPYIPLCACTEEQTEELAYGALRAILMRSKIADQFDIGVERVIRIGKRGMADGKAEAVASSPSARDGARTTFQGFDETHRFTTAALRRAHQTMLQNIPKRRASDSWSLETTTAYEPGERSVAEGTHNYAKMVAEGRLRDSRLFYFHRQAKDGYNYADREQRKKAVLEASGPVAAWSSTEEIVDLYDDPDVDRALWERLQLNRPIKAAHQAFNLEQWKALGTRILYRPSKGARITLGFDGARHEDATAVVGTEIETGFQWLVGLWEKPPNVQKWEVPQAEVEAAVDHAFTFWTVVRMYADPPYWETVVATWAGRYGEKRVLPFQTKSPMKMAAAVEGYVNAQLNGHLSHDGNTDFARHIGNANKRPLRWSHDQEHPLFVLAKATPNSPDKVDAAVAAVLSWEARTDAQKEGKPQKPRISVFGGEKPTGDVAPPDEDLEPEEAPWDELAW